MTPSSAILLIALACVPLAHSAVPQISELSPVAGPKEGGARITVTGAGFEDTQDLKCKFSRVNPDTEQVIEKLTDATYKSSTEIECDSPTWDEATCPYCDKETHGSTCLKSCANSYPWDSKEPHANVLMNDGSTHFNAEGNHHLSMGIGGARGKWPCPTCANEYDEHDNPNGQWPIGWKNTHNLGASQAATIFTGHHGSPYLRTNTQITPTDLGPGSFIKIEGQFFTVARIETCTGTGCWCNGQWSSSVLIANQSASSPITSYPIGPDDQSSDNNAMYNYDAQPAYWDTKAPPTCTAFGVLPADAAALTSPTGAAVTFDNSGSFAAGTKITLDQPLYLVGGTPYQQFFTNEVYISSKKPCVDCKCAEGCPLTVTVTNDGRSYSGGGTNGQTWHGSAAKFSAKHVVPEVFQIQFPSLSGYRDSSRMYVPNTGNSRIRVKGKNFQDSPLLRCFFDMPRVMHQAEFIDSETVECLVPQWVSRRSDAGLNTDPSLDNKCADAVAARAFANDITDNTASARLFDTMCTDSQTTGSAFFNLKTGASTAAAVRSFSHVQVTNNALHRDLSPVVHKRPDGAHSYLEAEGSLHRSTCYQLPYPATLIDSAVRPNHEQMEPCHNAHQDAVNPDPFHMANDVTIKYSTCYESLAAQTASGSNYRLIHATGKGQTPNSTHAYGQVFRIASTEAGPLVAVNLHLVKAKPSPTSSWCQDPTDCAEAARLPTTMEVCVSAGGFKGKGQTLACEWITIQNIKAGSEDFMVYFAKAPYLLGYYTTSGEPGFSAGRVFDGKYYLSLKHVSGPETVSWEMSDQTSGPALPGTNGFVFHPDSNATAAVETGHGFRATFYTCDGCRWKYQSLQTADSTSFQIGKVTGRQNQSDTYLSTHPGTRCTSQLTQAMGRSHVNEGYLTAEGLPRINTAEDPSGVYGDECGTPTYREQAAQAIRPIEDVTVTKMRTKMRGAWVNSATASHDDRTVAGDYKSADGATVSTWITEHGKLGEYVCQSFTGTTQTSDSDWLNQYDATPGSAGTNAASFGAATSGTDLLLGCGENNRDCMHCDTNGDGDFKELCFVGSLCNKTLPEKWGGCGVNGVCAMSEVVANAHVLRNHPDGSGPFASSCGEDVDCHNSQALKVAHSLHIPQASSATDRKDVIWEFKHPVKLKKHTTYYVNMAIDESVQRSDSIYWYAGSNGPTPAGPNRTPFLGSYTRTNVVVDGEMMFTWVKNTGKTFDLELMRCVTSLPSIESFSTAGAGTSSCSARSSPSAPGALITVKGQNFFPSANLRLVFLNGDGSMGPHAECTSTKYDYTEMTCVAPSNWNPDEGIDCAVPDNCQGVKLMPTNDGINYGPEYFSPKFYEPYNGCTPNRSPSLGCDAVPTFINKSHHFDNHFVQLLGENLLNFCFSNIYVSTSGNDHNGDGSKGRPFRSLQRAIDAANPADVITMMPGVYTGTGNRGLRHMNKKITVTTMGAEPAYGAACWCANNAPCTIQQGAATILNPACSGEKKYATATGISHRDLTVIDCEFAADGFVINNNKDSASPFSGYVDFSDITTRNCEQLRVYN